MVDEVARGSQTDRKEPAARRQNATHVMQRRAFLEVMEYCDHGGQVEVTANVGPRVSRDGDVRQSGATVRGVLKHGGVHVRTPDDVEVRRKDRQQLTAATT